MEERNMKRRYQFLLILSSLSLAGVFAYSATAQVPAVAASIGAPFDQVIRSRIVAMSFCEPRS